MFQRILVPVDGSALAERILGLVSGVLADGEGDAVDLLLVVDPNGFSEREREEAIPRHASLEDRLRAARDDLAGYVDLLSTEGIRATGEVVVGPPAEGILKRVDLTRPSLVAMATHGRGGLGRWVHGSVAERVLRRCGAPLLLCNPKLKLAPALFRRILVPLDGSEDSAAILPLVAALARVHHAQVFLLRISEIAGPSDMDEPSWVPLPSESDLRESLERDRAKLAEVGVEARCVALLDASAAGAILATVASQRMDLVALTTHARSRLDRWVFGSVAETVLRSSPAPVLVRRVGGYSPRISRDGFETSW